MTFDRQTELQLLEVLEENPETSQADLAVRVGVAVGTVNWYIKRWSKKGYVKVKRIGRWRWRYMLTPKGIKRRANLATRYIESSMVLYRATRVRANEILTEVMDNGFDQVVIDGEGDIADICALTCLELGITIIKEKNLQYPCLQITGTEIGLLWQRDMESKLVNNVSADESRKA